MNILGIGTDIVECLRIAHMIERHGEMFLGRVFTQQEIEYCSARKQATQHYAGRWAAKEAVLKALGTGWRGGIEFTDIEVLPDGYGKPVATLHGRTRELAASLGIRQMLVSISHGGEYAVATAIGVGG